MLYKRKYFPNLLKHKAGPFPVKINYKLKKGLENQHKSKKTLGSAAADNLRSSMFMKEQCVEEKVEAVLLSLDAKKAFDSVDHGYTY